MPEVLGDRSCDEGPASRIRQASDAFGQPLKAGRSAGNTRRAWGDPSVEWEIEHGEPVWINHACAALPLELVVGAAQAATTAHQERLQVCRKIRGRQGFEHNLHADSSWIAQADHQPLVSVE